MILATHNRERLLVPVRSNTYAERLQHESLGRELWIAI